MVGIATAQPSVIQPPSELVAFPGNGFVSMSWTPSADGSVVDYRVYRDQGPNGEPWEIGGFVETGGALSFIDRTAQNGIAYQYQVSAVNIFGLFSSKTEAVEATPLLSSVVPPGPLQAAVASGSTTLTWTPSPSAGTSYQIMRARSSPPLTVVAEVRGTTWVDTSLVDGIVYYFRIRAISGAGNVSPPSETMAITAGSAVLTPSNLQITAEDRSATLSWEWNGPDAQSFFVFRGLTPNALAAISEVGGSVRSFTDTGLVNGVRYYFALKASVPLGVGPPSHTVQVIPFAPLTSNPAPIPIGPVWDLAKIGDYVFAATNHGIYRTFPTTLPVWESAGLADEKVFTLAALSSGDALAGARHGVYRYSATSQTWSSRGPLESTEVHSLLEIQNGAGILAGTTDGVYQSFDGGDSWSASGLASIPVWALTETSGGDVYAGTSFAGSALLWRRAGASWEALASGGEPLSRAISILERMDGSLFVGTNRGPSLLFRDGSIVSSFSTEAGTLLAREGGVLIGSNSYPSSGLWYWSEADSTASRIGGAIIEYADVYSLDRIGEVVLAGLNSGQILISADNGESWSDYSIGVVPQEASGSVALAEPWTEISPGPSSAYYTSLLEHESGRLYAATLRDGLFASHDLGASWQRLENGLQANLFQIASDRRGGVLVGTFRGLYRSVDEGQSWSVLAFEDTTVTTVLATPAGVLAGFLARIGLRTSVDDGQTWSGRGMTSELNAVPLAYDRNLLFTGASTFQFGGAAHLDFVSGGFIAAESIAIADNGDRLIGGPGGVSISEDGGVSWSRPQLSDIHQVSWRRDGVWFAAGESGVFTSGSAGLEWSELSLGLPNAGVLSLAVAQDGYIFAGTRGGGLFRARTYLATSLTTISEPSRDARTGSDPTTFPNPTAGHFELRFGDAGGGPLTVSIFDALGRRATTWTTLGFRAGPLRFQVDASDWAPGVYFCRVEADGRVASTTIVVSR